MASTSDFNDEDSLDADRNAFHSNVKEQAQEAKCTDFSSNKENHQRAPLSNDVLKATLKRYFGHSSFRLHQGEIVRVSC